jgi:16S rRNA (uracil1498-N3)-methyltransferase
MKLPSLVTRVTSDSSDMARRRFFVPEIRRGEAELTGADAEHLVRVLRAEVGQRYEISDNRRVFVAEIEVARKSMVTFRVIEELPVAPRVAEVQLFAALFKFDRYEWMIEKATELGVDTIQPFQAIRSERGLFEASNKRRARWERIALEASQQARRARLPAVNAAAKLNGIVRAECGIRLLLDEESSASPILTVLESRDRKPHPEDTIGLVLGPEGGWTDEEKSALHNAGWLACSLGSTVLRAETAAIAGLSVINSVWRR